MGVNNIPLFASNDQSAFSPHFAYPSLTAGASDNTENVDWHLQQGSICINRGDNAAVMDSVDLDEMVRIKRDTVDLGCYESDYFSTPLTENRRPFGILSAVSLTAWYVASVILPEY